MNLRISVVALITLFAQLPGAGVSASPLYSDTVLADGALAYYRMSETSGTTVNDQVAANNGTYSGSGLTLNVAGPQAPAFPAFGASNAAVQFDGSTDNLVDIPSVAGLGASPYSMEVWFNNAGSGGLQYLLGRGSGDSLSYDAVGLNNTQLLFFNGSTVDSGPTISINTWHDLVLTRSGMSVKVYLDGVNVISDTSINATYGTSTRIVVGGRPGDATGYGSAGTYDELSIYNSALTAAQVANHFDPAQPVPEPGSLLLLGLAGVGLVAAVRVNRRCR